LAGAAFDGVSGAKLVELISPRRLWSFLYLLPKPTERGPLETNCYQAVSFFRRGLRISSFFSLFPFSQIGPLLWVSDIWIGNPKILRFPFSPPPSFFPFSYFSRIRLFVPPRSYSAWTSLGRTLLANWDVCGCLSLRPSPQGNQVCLSYAPDLLKELFATATPANWLSGFLPLVSPGFPLQTPPPPFR